MWKYAINTEYSRANTAIIRSLCVVHVLLALWNSGRGYVLRAAWAAARRAIGTRNGEQDT